MVAAVPRSTPLERLLASKEKRAAKKKSLAEKRKEEFQLWQDWKSSGEDPNRLRPLMSSLRPILKEQVKTYKGVVPIPNSAIEAEFKGHMLRALRTYDPGYNTQLHTHIHNQMMRGRRYITKYQNIGAIPEERAYKITPFRTAKTELEDELGREPTTPEIADRLMWSEREVARMEAEQRLDRPTSGYRTAEGDLWDPTALMPSKEMETIRLLQPSLPPEERLVFDFTFGLSGKPALRPGDIAKRANMSPSKVSRIRGKLTQKMKKYHGALD